jgi:carbon storage regulator CsrA
MWQIVIPNRDARTKVGRLRPHASSVIAVLSNALHRRKAWLGNDLAIFERGGKLCRIFWPCFCILVSPPTQQCQVGREIEGTLHEKTISPPQGGSDMLVLTRKIGERIRIGDDITLVVTKMAGNRVTLGIEAPKDVRIVRGELEQFVDAFRDADEDSHKAEERETAAMPVTFPFGAADACTYLPSQAR